MIPTEEMKLSEGRQIVSHQDDIELIAWQEKEISRLLLFNQWQYNKYADNLNEIKKLQIDGFIERIKDVYTKVSMNLLNEEKECENCKMVRDHCAELKYRIYQLSNEIANIRQDNEEKEKKKNWKTNKVIITIAVIITIINIAIHFLR
jgi:hypothetical protein